MLSILAVFAVLIALNAALVMMEYSLVRVRPSRIEVLARRGSGRAVRVQEMLAALDRYLAVVQVGITLVGLALGAVCEPAISSRIETRLLALIGQELPREVVDGIGFGLALLFLATSQIVLGELIPRALALRLAEPISLWSAYPLRFMSLIFDIPVTLMSSASNGAVRLLGLKPAPESEAIMSEDEMRILMGETHEKGKFPLERLFLLENIFDLGAAKVGEAMIARDKIAYLSLARSWAENLEVIKGRRYSRYPLCTEGLDTAVGLIHLKDLVLRDQLGKEPDLHHLRRDIAEVTEGEPLERLLKSFPDRGIQMALVRNALGQVTGMLTFEDIVEELVGEVHDEFDLPQAWSLSDWVMPGAVAMQLQAVDRRDAIEQLVFRLKAAEPSLDAAATIKAVWDREQLFSSAVGRGVAVPHARLGSLDKPLVAVGRFSKALPFPAPDAVPVRLLFLILTPAATPVAQLKVLSRIAALMSNETFRRKLMRAKSPESMLELLRTADTLLAT